jgi:zinc transport system substrate-binding protein
MPCRHAVAAWLVACVAAAPAGGAAAEPPAVVVSIKPIHSLAAGVLNGVGTPQLLIEGGGSPHSYALRPSHAQALARADLVLWVGEQLEGFLARPLSALSDDAAVVALADAAGLRLLPTRDAGIWAEHGEEEEHTGNGHAALERGSHDHGAIDMHVWLDPHNAAVMVGAIAAALSAADPERAATYEANATKIHADLARLDAELAATLAPTRNRPFVVFHDGYQYFEERYGLEAIGAITVDPQRAPGAARLRDMRAALENLGAACVFTEPQFRPALVETLVEGTGAGIGVLDPLGAELAAGPEQYHQLMRALARSLVDCLGTPRSG